MRKTIQSLTVLGLMLGGISIGQAQDKVSYEKDLVPLLRGSCYKCHLPSYKDERGRTRKPKAGLVLTNKKDLMEAEGEEGGKMFVAGDPAKSQMLQVLLLPIDADLHMPPEGKADQWTKEQIELMKKWIEEGADFGDFEADEEVEKDPAAWAAANK